MTLTESLTAREIASQPEAWETAVTRVDELGRLLTTPGERLLLLGCGTSAFVADSIARLREARGLGETQAAYASELPIGRRYDRVIALTRSGTTTEVLDALAALRGAATETAAVTAVHGSPVQAAVDRTVVLDFADEQSVVQTRFPTSTIALALLAFGAAGDELVGAAREALDRPLPVEPAEADHIVFLGHDWTLGLAHEAALKVREAAQAWSESYPMLDYRHGPIAVAGPRTVVWAFGPTPPDLVADISRTGAKVCTSDLHPLAQLVQAQRFAVAMAAARGLQPDTPRHLTRSVVLSAHRPGPSTSDLNGSN
ncbi:MAG: SIS domain-containing protein [Actinomycetes bacterium]